jgi:hypothetical protein
MEPNKENRRKITRKQFIQLCGSLLAGGSIAGMTGILLKRMYGTGGSSLSVRGGIRRILDVQPISPYRLVSSFSVPDRVDGFDVYGDKLIVAAPNNVYVYDRSGSLVNNFSIGSRLRDLAVDSGLIYLLFPTRIEVYSLEGEWVRDWEACSGQSDYCSLAVAFDCVFATDATNKNICQYTTEGDFVRFIQSPKGFIVPSYSFGITAVDGVVYCSNPGRHQVESYSPEGKYLGAFGQAGGAAGLFCGCCNPVHLSYTSTGEIITSEKGNPRISCYGKDGRFRSVLLDGGALGGGNVAYDVKVQNDHIFIAGKNKISTYRYDQTLVSSTACAGCVVDCPLRKGVTI